MVGFAIRLKMQQIILDEFFIPEEAMLLKQADGRCENGLS